MNDEQLKKQLENLKKSEYIYLSNWYGGKNKSGYNGYLVNFVDNSIYEFESIGTYTNTLTTEATLNKITTFPVELKTIFALYIKNEKLFYFDNIDKLVFDMGTSIEVSLGNVKSKIINADSTQIFKELDIATAKVTKEEMENIPHHLIDIKNINEDYTVFDYQKDCRNKIDEIINKNKTPILVGGTGLYIKAALYDYKFNKEEIKNDYSNYTNEELYNQVNILRRNNFMVQNGMNGKMSYEEYHNIYNFSRNYKNEC